MIYTADNLRIAFSFRDAPAADGYLTLDRSSYFSVVRTGGTLERIYALMPNIVLLPIRQGSKAPTISGWQRTKLSKTRQPWYQERLRQDGNVGVLLGTRGNGICTIDLDSDEDAERFLEANPKLRDGLITKGRRGINVWVSLIDEPPKLEKFGWGEWRSDGGQTVIAGTHPDGMPYRFISEEPPKQVLFSDIVFPFPDRPEVLHNIGLSIDIENDEEYSNDDKNDNDKPSLERLYIKLVEPYINPVPQTRNDNLVKTLSFLFYQTSPDVALGLGLLIYDKHKDVWRDSRGEHEGECKRFLESIAKDYSERLPIKAQEKFAVLDEKERIAFRICFSLARISDKRKFFLSARELMDRMGLPGPMSAQRLLEKLAKEDVIKPLKKGSLKDRKASTFRWLIGGKFKEREVMQKDAA